MPAKAPAKRPAKPVAKKAAAKPRTAGTPKVPPKPRKVAAPAKPKTAPPPATMRVAPASEPAKAQPAARPRPPPAAPPPEPAWLPVEAPAARAAEPMWLPAPGPAATPAPGFDAATGAWLPVPATAAAPAGPDPAAYRQGSTRTILLNVLLGIDLALLAFNFLAGIVVGLIRVFYPDSDAAQAIQENGITSPTALAIEAVLMLLLVGVIPFLWVLGTRVKPWEGTKKYLQLRAAPLDIVRGVLLVPLMLIAVLALSMVYVCATDGCGAVDEPADEPTGVDDILDNLTWPVAALVALGAGLGEEVLFRGVLQKRLRVWGQALAFGLAHAGNGYPPQVLFALGLGLAFGWLVKRNWSLVSLMVAHTLYDFTLLALALVYPELG